MISGPVVYGRRWAYLADRGARTLLLSPLRLSGCPGRPCEDPPGFAITFVARPFGGVALGLVGDVLGRKVSTFLSIFGMLCGTVVGARSRGREVARCLWWFDFFGFFGGGLLEKTGAWGHGNCGRNQK